MKRLTYYVILILLLVPFVSAQVDRRGRLPNRWHLPTDGQVLELKFGSDIYTEDRRAGLRNLLVESEDLTAIYTVFNATATDSDTLTLTDAAGYVYQGFVVIPGVLYTIAFEHKVGTLSAPKWALFDDSNTSWIAIDQAYSPGASWANLVYSFTAPAGCTLARLYMVRGAGSTGTIDLRRMSAIPGTYTAAEIEALGLYQATGDMQTVVNHAQRRRINLLEYSEDITQASAWGESGSGTIDDATHFTFVAQNDVVKDVLSITPANGQSVTFYVRARAVTGNTDLHFYHNGLSPPSTAVAVTNTLAHYAVTVTGDGGLITFGIQDQNAGGFGQIEVTQWQVNTGATPLSYQLKDASNENWLTPTIGATSSPGSDDPAFGLGRLSGLVAGSESDLTHAAWSASDGVATATTFTPTSGTGLKFIWTDSFDSASVATGTVILSSSDFTWAWLQIQAGEQSYVNLATCTAGTIAAGNTMTVEDLGGGRCRVSLTRAAGVQRLGIAPCIADGNTNVTGDGAKALTIEEMLGEVGDSADDGIPSDFRVANRHHAFLDFDGTDDGVRYTGALGPTGDADRTLIAVFKQDAGGDDAIVGYAKSSPGVGETFHLGTESGGKLTVFMNSDGVTSTTLSPVVGQWNIGAVVYDGTDATFWLNGTSNAVAKAGISSTQGVFDVGMFTNFGTLPFDGQIAYVAVYDIAYASNRMKPWAFALATELCDDQDIVCQVRTQLAYRIESERLMELARLSMDPRKQQQDQWYETFAQLKRGEAWDRRNVKVEIQ